MEVLIHQQMALAGYIARMWINLQKLGQARIMELELKSRLERLEDYWTTFQANHFNLLAFNELETTEYDKKDTFSTVEGNYFGVKNKFRSALMTMREDEGVEQNKSLSTQPVKSLQLSKITFPKFSGDQLAWKKFRDLFKALVHKVSDIAPMQKLQYLRSCLARLRALYLKSPDNAYAGAWEDLCARYNNRRILLYVHMRELLSCPSTAKSTAAEIKRLLGVVNQAVRAFTSLKRSVDYWDD